VIARKNAIVVHGETTGAPFITDLKGLARTWAGSIERIILVARMCRGWAPEIARDWFQSAFQSFHSVTHVSFSSGAPCFIPPAASILVANHPNLIDAVVAPDRLQMRGR
jgi:hypothetical protein